MHVHTRPTRPNKLIMPFISIYNHGLKPLRPTPHSRAYTRISVHITGRRT
jgi:hypothetical protein